MPDQFIITVRRHPVRSTGITILGLLILGSLLWWYLIWQNPQRVFVDMLSNNLATTSVTKVASATSSGQSISQYIRQEMGSTNAAEWLVMVRQSGSTVTTESIATPSVAYLRYLTIATNQKSATNKPYNFAHVLNTWGKADGKTDSSLGELFDQTLLDISSAPLPPIGNTSYARRQTILAYMQNEKIFQPSYAKVKSETVNNRQVYTYQVSVALGAYVRMMQGFAHSFNITSLDSIDPSQYSTAPPLTIVMSVDKASHQLVRAAYPANGFSQSYSDWGLQTPITVPHATLSTSDLQSRVLQSEAQ